MQQKLEELKGQEMIFELAVMITDKLSFIEKPEPNYSFHEQMIKRKEEERVLFLSIYSRLKPRMSKAPATQLLKILWWMRF